MSPTNPARPRCTCRRSRAPAKTRVSTAGGIEAIWTASGRELLFRTGAPGIHRFMAATIESTSPLRVGPPRVLFEAKPSEYDATTPLRAWDAMPDAQHFILTRVDDGAVKPVTAMHVVLNQTFLSVAGASGRTHAGRRSVARRPPSGDSPSAIDPP
jgi:hypothetical protein